MTFEDTDEPQQTYQADNMVQIGSALHDLLVDAQTAGRIIYGLNASCEFLAMNADAVMVCVLPVNVADDVTMHIHFTLIEAFCWENEIRLIKVDSGEKLAKLLLSHPSSVSDANDNAVSRVGGGCGGLNSNDVDCILVEYPKTRCSESDDDVLEFCKMTSNDSPQPIVDLAI